MCIVLSCTRDGLGMPGTLMKITGVPCMGQNQPGLGLVTRVALNAVGPLRRRPQRVTDHVEHAHRATVDVTESDPRCRVGAAVGLDHPGTRLC
jgi:hypothetical protein